MAGSRTFSFSLDGVTFEGCSIGAFHLADEAQYDQAQTKFCILKWGGYIQRFHITAPYSYDLQRYALEVEIPVPIVCRQDDSEVRRMLHLAFQYVEHNRKWLQSQMFCDGIRVYCDDVIVSEFSLYVDGVRYESEEKTLKFEWH